jgi:hypothetical protein
MHGVLSTEDCMYHQGWDVMGGGWRGMGWDGWDGTSVLPPVSSLRPLFQKSFPLVPIHTNSPHPISPIPPFNAVHTLSCTTVSL